MSVAGRSLAPFVGAAAHPRSASAIYLPELGYCSPGDWPHADAPGPVYEFNSLGFRGCEYDPNASLRVFVCGCSYALGMGVHQDGSWPAVFTRRAAAALGTPVEHSNLQNFSQIGASNNYVTRTLLTQCDRHPPSLAIAAFTHTSRTEYLDGPATRNLGNWDLHPQNVSREGPGSPGRRFFRQHCSRAGLRNLLANMVLFQSAMERRAVPYIIIWVDVDALKTRTLAMSGLRDYAAVLNRSRISRLSIRQSGIFVDAADGAAAAGHPGPQSHERFAAALCEEFKDRLLARRPVNQARQRKATINLGGRSRTSADRLVRSSLRAARWRPPAIRLSFGDNLAAEYFSGGRVIEIDLERHAWSPGGARLRAAHADYVTADLLRFNFWLNLLTAQEYMLACGVRPEIAVPHDWSLEAVTNPVLEQLAGLVDGEVVSVKATATMLHNDRLAARLDAAKHRIRHSRIEAWLRQYGKAPRHHADDFNSYPLW